MWKAICSQTFSTYEDAALRYSNDGKEVWKPLNLYTMENLVPVVMCSMKMVLYIICPYLLVGYFYFYLSAGWVLYNSHAVEENYWITKEYWQQFKLISFQLVACFTTSVAIVSHFYLVPVASPRDGQKGTPIYGASTAPGLYYTRVSDRISRIVNRCKFLKSPRAVDGGLDNSSDNQRNSETNKVLNKSATPWLISGDIRTLVPFITFNTSDIIYERRWVRVPVAKGPCDETFVELESNVPDNKYEAVALDCAFPNHPIVQKNKNCGNVALLLLSGLTGGSTEGYVVDMANHARSKNWLVFVMTGRGLAGCPCRSGELFHGARTSDIVASAKAIRAALPKDTRLFLGGISLGAIIAANACAQGYLDDIIDGCVCISGCFDTEINSTYGHSLRAWQPILNLPLKEAFVSPSGNMDKIISKIGINSHSVVSNIHTISQFDSSFITPLHGFNDPRHYYSVMSAGMDNKLQKLTIPMLAIHALDDPILHVDTMPTKVASEGTLTDKLIVLVTKTGGHVGWPIGLFPWLNRWEFQNTLTSEFIEAVLDEILEKQFHKTNERVESDGETPTC